MMIIRVGKYNLRLRGLKTIENNNETVTDLCITQPNPTVNLLVQADLVLVPPVSSWIPDESLQISVPKALDLAITEQFNLDLYKINTRSTWSVS